MTKFALIEMGKDYHKVIETFTGDNAKEMALEEGNKIYRKYNKDVTIVCASADFDDDDNLTKQRFEIYQAW